MSGVITMPATNECIDDAAVDAEDLAAGRDVLALLSTTATSTPRVGAAAAL
jgi:hypothetical protein